MNISKRNVIFGAFAVVLFFSVMFVMSNLFGKVPYEKNKTEEDIPVVVENTTDTQEESVRNSPLQNEEELVAAIEEPNLVPALEEGTPPQDIPTTIEKDTECFQIENGKKINAYGKPCRE